MNQYTEIISNALADTKGRILDAIILTPFIAIINRLIGVLSIFIPRWIKRVNAWLKGKEYISDVEEMRTQAVFYMKQDLKRYIDEKLIRKRI